MGRVAREKDAKHNGNRVQAALSVFPATFRGTLLPYFAVFTVEIVYLFRTLVVDIGEESRKRKEAGGDKRALAQLSKLKKRRNPYSKFFKYATLFEPPWCMAM